MKNKSKKIKKAVEISIPIYGYIVVVLVYKDSDDAYKKLKHIDKGLADEMVERINNWKSHHMATVSSINDGLCVLSVKDKKLSEEMLAHECLHIVFNIMHTFGLEHDTSYSSFAASNEHLTYLLQYLIYACRQALNSQ